MPAQYEKIKQAMLAKGMDTREAKTHASKIYVARGAGGSRHDRAKRLAADRKSSR